MRFSAAEVVAHCAGNPPGYVFWKSKIKDGRPSGWPIDLEKSKAFTEEERERLLEALGSLPEALQLKSVFGFYRMDRSRYFPNPASGDAGRENISIYDSAFDRDRNLVEVISHELAHSLYRTFSENESKQYEDASGWTTVRNEGNKDIIGYIRRSDGFVLEDGKDSPQEDFANNLQYFLFHPNDLSHTTPNVYNWIKSHYGSRFAIRKGSQNVP